MLVVGRPRVSCSDPTSQLMWDDTVSCLSQRRVGQAHIAQDACFHFDNLSLPEGYGQGLHQHVHALHICHPLLPNQDCWIDFDVSDRVGEAEAHVAFNQKQEAYDQATGALVRCANCRDRCALLRRRKEIVWSMFGNDWTAIISEYSVRLAHGCV